MSDRGQGRGGRRGKGRGKRGGGGRGRGGHQQQRQSESLPGNLQHHQPEVTTPIAQEEPQQQHRQQQQQQQHRQQQQQQHRQQQQQQQHRQQQQQQHRQQQQQQHRQQQQQSHGQEQTPQHQHERQEGRQSQQSHKQQQQQVRKQKPKQRPEDQPDSGGASNVHDSSSQGVSQPYGPPPTKTQPQTQPTSSETPITPETPRGAEKPDPTSKVKSTPPRSSKAVAKPPRRPDTGGKSGRRINLRVNFLLVKLPTEDVHHYDSDICEKGKKSEEGFTKSERPKIIREVQKLYEKDNPNGPKWVYDKNGKNIYCRTKIPGYESGRQYTLQFVTDNGKEKTFIVDIKWVAVCSLYDLNEALEGRHTEIPYDTMQAIEVVIQQMPKMSTIQVRSSFFDFPTGREKDLGGGVQVWNGTFLSIRPTQWKMMLNVDTSATGFYKGQPVIDFMCEFLNCRNLPRQLDQRQKMKFGKEIKAIKVETTYMKRKQKANGLSNKSAREETFEHDGRQVTVLQYFKEFKNITLKHPDLPCIKIGQRSLIPMELCRVVDGQKKQGKLTGRQTQQMIRCTAIPAPDRMQKIMDLIRKLHFERDPYTRDFGINIGNELLTIQGRVLDPPPITFGPGNRPSNEIPRDGAWKITKKMLDPKELKEWALISFKKNTPGRGRGPDHLDQRGMDDLIYYLLEVGREKGVRVNDPCHVSLQTGIKGIEKQFGELKSRYPNLQLIVVVLPMDGDDFYEEVKHCGDVIHGITTQCIKVEKASEDFSDWRKKETLVNLWLKINAKLGGTTFALDKGMKSPILKRPVIIFGADVTHPGAGNKSSPSIAAVVASKDSYPTLYNAEVRAQKHRQEMIEDLKEMTKTLLKKFRASTKAIPEKIIFYRDGVSEGQFQDVLINELYAVQRACAELQSGWQPAITFIVVQKRHHARLFAVDPKDRKGRSQNIPAGTVVDTQICHPYEFNFYLCSHAGIQGTSKPALYHVLYDDSNFTSDDLQILTNQLCYTYVRCSRSVSIPAPAYYAHHVAFRARHHLKMDTATEGSTVSDESELKEVTTEQRNLIKVHPNVNCTMYFA